jgi:hypothetical protein
MFALLSNVFRSARPCIWRRATRPFSCFDPLSTSPECRGRGRPKAPVRSAEEEAAHLERQRLERNANQQQRYTEDPGYRQRILDHSKKYARRPDRRDVIKAHARMHRENNHKKYRASRAHAWVEDLRLRRAKTLYTIFQRGGTDRYTWKTHTPTRYPDRVDHHCTGCNRERFLMLWWKEKPQTPKLTEQSDTDRYMCNTCFANDWPRVVPETYTGRLHRLFRSPDLPLSTAQLKELAKQKEPESDKPKK